MIPQALLDGARSAGGWSDPLAGMVIVAYGVAEGRAAWRTELKDTGSRR